MLDRFLPAKGGAEVWLDALARRLAARGHEVSIVAREHAPGPLPGRALAVPGPRRPRFLADWSFAHRSAREAARAGLDVTLGVRHTPFVDVLQLHGGVYRAALEASLESGGRGLAFRRAVRALSPKTRMLLRLERMLARDAARPLHVAVSPMVARELRTWLGVPEERIRVIPPGVDAARFRGDAARAARPALRARVNAAEGDLVVAFVAHNFRLKGLGFLLAALARTRARLLVAGRGRPGAAAARARRLGIADRVAFLGAVSRVEEVYAAADAFALPTWYDPCSLATLEAAAAGLPVVTTRRNGVAAWMEEGREGFVVERPDDVDGLAAALRRLEDPARRAALQAPARALGARFPREESFTCMEAVLTEAATRRSR